MLIRMRGYRTDDSNGGNPVALPMAPPSRLSLLHLMSDSGLKQIQRLGGSGETATADNLSKCFQLIKIERAQKR